MATVRLPEWLMAAAAGLSGFLLMLGGGTLYPLLQPEAVMTLPHDPACDLRQGSCSSILPQGGKVIFGIEPRSLPVLQPLALSVALEGLDASKVEARFNGVDMNMGINHADLQTRGGGRFSGTVTIPVCIRNSMEWEAVIMLHTADGVIAVPYRFWSSK